MFSLLANENMKIYRRLRTWVLLAVVVVIAGLISVSMYKMVPPDVFGLDWQSRLNRQIQQDQKQLASASLAPGERQRLAERIKLSRYRLEHNLPPAESVRTLWTGVQQSAELMIMVTIFTVIIAGDAVAGEFHWGTIKLLLIRPYSRSRILFSKYLAVLLFALFLAAGLLVSSFAINALLYGFRNVGLVDLSLDADGQVRETGMFLKVLGAYALRGVELFMTVSLAFMLSTVFRSSTLAVGITMFITFAGQLITMLLSRFPWGKYWLYANTDLSVYMNGNTPPEGMSLGFSVAVLAVYYVLFTALSWIIFNRRDVSV